MKDYTYTLAERRKRCEAEKARYWRDPEYRLARINRARQQYGAPPRASLDEVAPRRGGEA